MQELKNVAKIFVTMHRNNMDTCDNFNIVTKLLQQFEINTKSTNLS